MDNSNKLNSDVLKKSLLKLGDILGLSLSDLAVIIGADQTIFSDGIKLGNKEADNALILLNCYKNVHQLVGGDADWLKHWFSTYNHHTSGVPLEQIQTHIEK